MKAGGKGMGQKTRICAGGITYGLGEELFHHYFKVGWAAFSLLFHGPKRYLQDI